MNVTNNLLKIQLDYLKALYDQLPEDLAERLPARRKNNSFHFKAFGQNCTISADGIILGREKLTGPTGILIALYARYARREAVQLEPIKSFKEIKGTMPYHGGFTARTERSLNPFVENIQRLKEKIISDFDGHENEGTMWDFSLTLYPLPKVPLFYIFYLADEEFPASVTCLLASNAELFMPLDGLADVGEYTAKRVIEIVSST